MLLITAILGTTIVNAQSGTTVANSQLTNLSDSSWYSWYSWYNESTPNVDSAVDTATSSESVNITQLHMDKMKYLQSKKDNQTGSIRTSIAQANSIQPLSSSSAECLVTVATDYNNMAYNAANSIASAYGGDALKGTSDTQANAENYWRSDSQLCYYTNIGESAPFTQGGYDCTYLRFNDGNGNSYPVSAGTIQHLSPDTGLYGADDYICSCYSYNDPMLTAYTTHMANIYIGGKIELNAITSTNVCDKFWSYYSGDGNPNTALQNACNYYSESNQNYGVIYHGYW